MPAPPPPAVFQYMKTWNSSIFGNSFGPLLVTVGTLLQEPLQLVSIRTTWQREYAHTKLVTPIKTGNYIPADQASVCGAHPKGLRSSTSSNM